MDNVNRSKSHPLAGVTAFVDVRAEHDNRSKAISNELERLGATIADRLTKNVTHVVFKDGRSSTVTQMQKLGNCHFVSVLWVDSCKTTQSHVTEMLFPAKLPQNFDSPLPSRVRVKSLQPKTFEQDLNKSAKKEHKKRSRLKRINKEVETPDQIICFDSQEYMKSSDLYKLVKTPQMVPETPYVFSYITGDFDQTEDTLDDLNVSFEKGTLHDDDHEFIRGTPMCPTKQILQNKRYKTDRRRKSRLSEKSKRKSVHFSQTDKQSITSYTITSPTKRGSSEPSGGGKSPEKLIKMDKTTLANFNVSDEIDSTPLSVEHTVAKSPDKHQSDNDFSVNKCRFPTLPGTSCEENPLVSSWKALNACLLSSDNEEELDKENLIPQKASIKSTKIKNDITNCGKVISHDKGKEMKTDNKQNPSAKSKDSILKPVTRRSSGVNFKIIKKFCSHSPTAEDPDLCSTPLSNESSQENLNSSFVHDETEGLVLALQIQECDLDLANDDISNLMRQGKDDVDRTKETSDSSAHNNNTIETQPLDSRWVIRNEQRERSLAKPLFNSEDTQDDTFEKENGSNKEIQQINSEEEDTCNEHTQHDNLIEQNNFNEETQRNNPPKNSSNKETKHNRSAEKHPSIEATLHGNPTEETSSNAEQPGIPPEEPDVVGDSGISESEETAEPSFQESRTEPTIQESRTEPTIQESRTEPTIQESRTEPTIQESRNRCTAPSRTRIKSTKKSKVSFVATSLHFGEHEFVKAAVQSLGGFLLRTCVQPNTTHVVAGSARRTLNILYAIVKGCWILTPKWVSDSYEKGKWLKEDGYEMSEEFPAAKLSRTHFEKHGKSGHANLLSKVKPIYLADETKPPHDELVYLILACGGKITTSMRKAGFSIGLSRCRRKEFPSISEKWLLDSIMRGTVLPTSAYQIQVQSGSRSPAF